MIVRRARLADRRKAVGLSQEKLAELLGVDVSTVRRWESRTTEPQPWLRPKLARTLKVSVEELANLLDEGRLTALSRVPEVLETTRADLLQVGELQDVDLLEAMGSTKQQALLRGIAVVAAASGLLEGHLPAGSRRLGVNDVARINALNALYHSVDREFGGGLLCDHVARFAESASSLLAQSYADSLAPGLFRAVSAARLLAGWAAFDACRHLDAQRHFQSAESAAIAVDDLLFASRVRYCQARQLQHIRHNQDALDRLLLAQRQLDGAATPAITAKLNATTATSLAALGDRRAALVALDAARANFERIDMDKEPDWMAFYDQGELLAQFGRVYRDFARADRKQGRVALPFVQQALPAYSPHNVRSTVFGEVSLCSALFLANEPEEALIVGARVIGQAQRLTSPRIFDRIRNVQRDLKDHLGLPDVADFAHTLKNITPAAAS